MVEHNPHISHRPADGTPNGILGDGSWSTRHTMFIRGLEENNGVLAGEQMHALSRDAVAVLSARNILLASRFIRGIRLEAADKPALRVEPAPRTRGFIDGTSAIVDSILRDERFTSNAVDTHQVHPQSSLVDLLHGEQTLSLEAYGTLLRRTADTYLLGDIAAKEALAAEAVVAEEGLDVSDPEGAGTFHAVQLFMREAAQSMS